MTWKVSHQGTGLSGQEQYRYNLEFWDHGVYDKTKTKGEVLHGALKYQGWAMGGCSTAQCWGWIHMGKTCCTKEHLVGFIDALKSIASASMYDPKMFFAQLPAEGREGFSSAFWKFMVGEVFPDLQPVFTYENRAHDSTLQRLYYVDTVPLYKYAEKYHAEKKAAERAAVVVPSAGTIIKPHPEQDHNGVRYEHYFDEHRK